MKRNNCCCKSPSYYKQDNNVFFTIIVIIILFTAFMYHNFAEFREHLPMLLHKIFEVYLKILDFFVTNIANA